MPLKDLTVKHEVFLSVTSAPFYLSVWGFDSLSIFFGIYHSAYFSSQEATHAHTRTHALLHVVLTSSHLVSLHRGLEEAAASSGDQVEGVCDGGGGEGEKSHDICAPAGGSL